MSDETEMVAKMFDRVIAERDAARAQVAKLTQERDEFERKGKELCNAYGNSLIKIHDLEHELSQARAAAEAMGRPVSDDEWGVCNVPSFKEIDALHRKMADALIAARVRDSKEAGDGKCDRES